MKATNEHFRCDLCGKFRNLGVTESYTVETSGNLEHRSTICVPCIRDATRILLTGMVDAADAAADAKTPA